VSHRTKIDDIVQRTTPPVTFQILNDAGVGFKPSTLTMTIYNLDDDKTIINGRDHVAALDTLITVDANGNAEWIPAPADTDVTAGNTTGDHERHVLLLEWTWDSGNRHGKHELEHKIINLARVPT
jgi:hypothetical protein